MREEWRGFTGTKWLDEVNMREFIQSNYTGYDGDAEFLANPTEATDKLWGRLKELQKEERAKGGVLDMETEIVSSMTAYGAGYIDESMKDLEKVVGLQTDKPLKRAFMPYGGIKMEEQACTTYGYQPSEKLHEIFTKYCKTHNDGVFDAYTDEMKATLLLPAGVTSSASISYRDEDEVISKYVDNKHSIDDVYIEKILPEKMKYNLNYFYKYTLAKDLILCVKTIL